MARSLSDDPVAERPADLEPTEVPPSAGLPARAWSAAWPKLAAVGVALVVWQLVVWSGWRALHVLPAPADVLGRLVGDVVSGELAVAGGTTLRRALAGYGLALGVGSGLGLCVARVPWLRAAVGSLITGLQTMPSITWFPLAMLLFQVSDGAILFVVVLGAAPSIANGLVSGIDHIPPPLLRAGWVMGARGLAAYRHIVLPAALPGFVAGLKQGWAFAWRSLLAGELLIAVGGPQSIGVRLQLARERLDTTGLVATMLAILLVGIVVDAVVFATVERTLRRRRGLLV